MYIYFWRHAQCYNPVPYLPLKRNNFSFKMIAIWNSTRVNLSICIRGMREYSDKSLCVFILTKIQFFQIKSNFIKDL